MEQLLAVRQVDGAENFIAPRNEDPAGVDGWRTVDRALCFEFPHRVSVGGREAIEVLVVRSDKDMIRKPRG